MIGDEPPSPLQCFLGDVLVRTLCCFPPLPGCFDAFYTAQACCALPAPQEKPRNRSVRVRARHTSRCLAGCHGDLLDFSRVSPLRYKGWRAKCPIQRLVAATTAVLLPNWQGWSPFEFGDEATSAHVPNRSWLSAKLLAALEPCRDFPDEQLFEFTAVTKSQLRHFAWANDGGCPPRCDDLPPLLRENSDHSSAGIHRRAYAIDMGSSEGSDAVQLLTRGMRVIAIDANFKMAVASLERLESTYNRLISAPTGSDALSFDVLWAAMVPSQKQICDIDARMRPRQRSPFFTEAGEATLRAYGWKGCFAWVHLSNDTVTSRAYDSPVKNKGMKLELVPAISCSSLFRAVGFVYVLKVDIEGGDVECLRDLAEHVSADSSTPRIMGGPAKEKYGPDVLRPRYVSLEVGSLQPNDPEAFRAIQILQRLGYGEFKLVRQSTYHTWPGGAWSGPLGEDAVDWRSGAVWRSAAEVTADFGLLASKMRGDPRSTVGSLLGSRFPGSPLQWEWFDLHARLSDRQLGQ